MDKNYSHSQKNTNRSTAEKTITINISKKKLITVGIYGVCVLIILLGGIFFVRHLRNKEKPVEKTIEATTEEALVIPDLTGVADAFPDLPITEDFLTVNRYSRPGIGLSSSPQYIVVHYTANPGSTGWDNRNYFENLKDTGETFASAQFVIGLDGQIIQCVPCNEMAYCSNSYNEFCISIEMCHPDDTGNFNDETYNSCVYLVAHLMNYYHLDMDHLIRHYDVTGKNCPKYFVENPERWDMFKEFVEKYREEYKASDEALYEERLEQSKQEQTTELSTEK